MLLETLVETLLRCLGGSDSVTCLSFITGSVVGGACTLDFKGRLNFFYYWDLTSLNFINVLPEGESRLTSLGMNNAGFSSVKYCLILSFSYIIFWSLGLFFIFSV